MTNSAISLRLTIQAATDALALAASLSDAEAAVVRAMEEALAPLVALAKTQLAVPLMRCSPPARLHCPKRTWYARLHGGGQVHAAWSKWPSWWRHGWPPAARLAGSEGPELPSATVRRRPASQIPQNGRGVGARRRPRRHSHCVCPFRWRRCTRTCAATATTAGTTSGCC